jgi:hypothetical protein
MVAEVPDRRPLVRRRDTRNSRFTERKSDMSTRTLRGLVLALFAAVAIAGTAGRSWAIGFVLSQTKEELKLKYDVAVEEHSSGRVTVVLTLADEGRLKPLDDVQLVIPGQEKNADGSHWMDLVVSIDMRQADDGKRVGRVHIRKEMARRAEIQLNTHTMDGKLDPLTRLHHVIPIAKHLKNAAAPAAPAPEPK